MKKYLFIYKLSIMSTFQYISNIFINSFGYVIHVFIFFYLWNYMYDNPNELINGYSKYQMIWYVTYTEIIWSCLGARRLCRDICEDVRSGNITYNINKPYNYIGYVFSNHLGTVSIKYIIYAIIGLVIGITLNGVLPKIGLLSIIFVFVASVISIAINLMFIIGIGLISFLIEDSYPLFWLYSKAVLILGTIFPIEFFPGFLQEIARYSPIYAMCYGPAKLFVDFNWNEVINITIAQIIYLFISYIFCFVIYKKGVKKINVNGG